VQFSDAALVAAYEKTRNMALLLAAGGMFIIAIVGLVTGFALTRRLGVMTEVARRFADGDRAVRSKVAGADEISELSHSFDRMADAVGQQEHELKAQNEYIELLLNSTSEAIYGVDTQGRCTFVNLACLEMLGYELESDLIGKRIHELIHHTHPDGRPYPMTQCRIHLATQSGMAAHVDDELHWRADGSSFPVEYWSHPMRRDGRLVGTVVAFTDISDRKRAEGKIKELAFFDQLTGLPNRTLLIDRLRQAMVSTLRNGNYGALLFIDLDNFKTLNDTLGHDMGDLLLKKVAQRLRHCVREVDTVARLGGDEFMVVTAELGADEGVAANGIEMIAEKILTALNHPFPLGIVEHHCTASIGVTLFQGDRASVEDLMKQADLAMYKSKSSGRNIVRFFDSALELAVKERAALEEDLRHGLAQKQFELHYQAQIVGERHITGAEVLLRWQHPKRGMVSPAEFISIAEESGLILPLGHWVLETACRQLKAWSAQPGMADLTLSVNVSAQQFHQKDFVDLVLAVLQDTGADPRRLKLELTESLLLRNVDAVIEKMLALKAAGVGFSLDDFGTGYSSLMYLKRLPLDQLKIDKSFVGDLLNDRNNVAIAKTIVALAQSLDMDVIAEGVETVMQRDLLAGMGCNSYQGYFFSHPLPLQAFEQFAQGT
jgi:diguanylate cyclase (GGDEF)-like protein/PAS domain S-box-containing protein